MLPEIWVSLDFDGVLYDRGPLNYQFKAELGLVTSANIFPEPPDPLPKADRTVRNVDIAWRNIPSYLAHKFRPIIPESRDAVIEYANKGVIFDCNTGRSTREKFVNLTEDSLKPFDLRSFLRDIYYKPPGWSSSLSKAVGIQEMKEKAKRLGKVVKIFHAEDNLVDGVFVARAHPDVTIIIIEDKSTERLKKHMPSGVNNLVYANSLRQRLDENVKPLLQAGS